MCDRISNGLNRGYTLSHAQPFPRNRVYSAHNDGVLRLSITVYISEFN
jgi:hypothetical protein